MFGNLVGQDLGLGCSVLQPFASSSPLQPDALSPLQTAPSAGSQLLAFPAPGSNNDPAPISLLQPFGTTGAVSGGGLPMKQESGSSSLSSATAAVLTREVLMELLPQRKKGKGGRQPAQDPRLDPSIDPKRAKRILANRQSAARSKLKQKMLMDGLRSRQNVLAVQRDAAAKELCTLSAQCQQLERDNQLMRCRLQALADQFRLKSALTSKLTTERDQLAHHLPPAPPPAPAPAPTTQQQQAPANAWAPSLLDGFNGGAAPGSTQGAPQSLLQPLGASLGEVGVLQRPQHGHCHLLPVTNSQQLALQCP